MRYLTWPSFGYAVFYVTSGICLILNKCFFVCVGSDWMKLVTDKNMTHPYIQKITTVASYSNLLTSSLPSMMMREREKYRYGSMWNVDQETTVSIHQMSYKKLLGQDVMVKKEPPQHSPVRLHPAHTINLNGGAGGSSLVCSCRLMNNWSAFWGAQCCVSVLHPFCSYFMLSGESFCAGGCWKVTWAENLGVAQKCSCNRDPWVILNHPSAMQKSCLNISM